MKWEKGQSGNPNGRPKGSKGHDVSALREALTELIERNFDKLEEDLLSLTPSERVTAYTKLAAFVLPKMKALEIREEIDYGDINWPEWMQNDE